MIRRGTFCSISELEQAICQWLATWNNQPKPFVWKTTADVILDPTFSSIRSAALGKLLQNLRWDRD
jgi:hypothetical protein